jgi:hypothetical protein
MLSRGRELRPNDWWHRYGPRQNSTPADLRADLPKAVAEPAIRQPKRRSRLYPGKRPWLRPLHWILSRLCTIDLGSVPFFIRFRRFRRPPAACGARPLDRPSPSDMPGGRSPISNFSSRRRPARTTSLALWYRPEATKLAIKWSSCGVSDTLRLGLGGTPMSPQQCQTLPC